MYNYGHFYLTYVQNKAMPPYHTVSPKTSRKGLYFFFLHLCGVALPVHTVCSAGPLMSLSPFTFISFVSRTDAIVLRMYVTECYAGFSCFADLAHLDRPGQPVGDHQRRPGARPADVDQLPHRVSRRGRLPRGHPRHAVGHLRAGKGPFEIRDSTM